MNCTQCGNQLAATDRVCGKCGTPAGPVSEPAPVQAAGGSPSQTSQKKSGLGLKIILVLAAIVLVNLFITDADRDETGTIIAEGNLDAMEMQIGDCFDDSAGISSEETVEIQSVHGIPCSQPHDNEVYAKFDLELDEFPGEEQIVEFADEGCMERFEAFVGLVYEESILDIFYMFPTRETWNLMNDREIVCAVFHAEGEKLSASMKASGI